MSKVANLLQVLSSAVGPYSSLRYMSMSTGKTAQVGFIGLGNMGYPMAVNLRKAGYDLVVYDSNKDNAKRLCDDHGAFIVNSPVEVATTEGIRIVFSMLPSAKAVKEVYMGRDGILTSETGIAAPLLVDSSTIDPTTSQEVAKAAASARLMHGVDALPSSSSDHPVMVDAPVSGGVPAAQAGSLTFMCGGGEGAVQAAQEYLSHMGKRVVHCGPPGAGQAAKVCNNLVLGVSMAAVSEGLALGQKLGLDPALLSDVFNTSSARCWSSDTYNPCPGVMPSVPASRDYKQGFAVPLMLKDLGLACDAAQSVGATLSLGELAAQLYRKVAEVDSSCDFSAVYKYVYKGLPK